MVEKNPKLKAWIVYYWFFFLYMALTYGCCLWRCYSIKMRPEKRSLICVSRTNIYIFVGPNIKILPIPTTTFRKNMYLHTILQSGKWVAHVDRLMFPACVSVYQSYESISKIFNQNWMNIVFQIRTFVFATHSIRFDWT